MLKQVKSGEIVPVHDIKAHGGSGGIAPFILNIGCRSTFTLRLLDACGEGGGDMPCTEGWVGLRVGLNVLK